jgi:hypothetical protein
MCVCHVKQKQFEICDVILLTRVVGGTTHMAVTFCVFGAIKVCSYKPVMPT